MTARFESLPAGEPLPVSRLPVAPRRPTLKLKRDGVADFLDGLLEQYEQSARTLRAQLKRESARTA